ncbi:MAG: hypothetical protein JNN04_03040 [Cyclobacteriaceae bacterium]|nr:hypothetical protein [Cyclobacteriaceae bacterium]
MTLLAFLFLILSAQDAAPPLKSAEEFKVELEYKFKKRPSADNTFIDLTETVAEKEKRTQVSTPLPYLIIHLSFTTLSDQEVRVRCTDNFHKNRFSKKAETGKIYTVDLGFTEDMKDRVTAHEYTFDLLSPDKKETSQIVLRVEEDGTFLVNGARRGKF